MTTATMDAALADLKEQEQTLTALRVDKDGCEARLATIPDELAQARLDGDNKKVDFLTDERRQWQRQLDELNADIPALEHKLARIRAATAKRQATEDLIPDLVAQLKAAAIETTANDDAVGTLAESIAEGLRASDDLWARTAGLYKQLAAVLDRHGLPPITDLPRIEPPAQRPAIKQALKTIDAVHLTENLSSAPTLQVVGDDGKKKVVVDARAGFEATHERAPHDLRPPRKTYIEVKGTPAYANIQLAGGKKDWNPPITNEELRQAERKARRQEAKIGMAL